MTKVLYVDHHYDRINQIRDILSDNYSIDVSFNGWEGVGATMLYSPDIVIINLVVPVMDGIEAMRLIRSEKDLHSLPILAFSDPSNKEAEEIVENTDYAKIISYPFCKEELLSAINELSHRKITI